MSSQPSDTEWAWLAGFIDGEGCFHLGWSLRGNSLKMRPCIILVLRRAETENELLKNIHKRFGGYIQMNLTKAPRLTWQSMVSVTYLIDGIYPYLRLKQQQAKLLKQAIEVQRRTPKAQTKPMSDWEELISINAQMTDLNSRKKLRKWNSDYLLSMLRSKPAYTEQSRTEKTKHWKATLFQPGFDPRRTALRDPDTGRFFPKEKGEC
jgi:hypothetical protein